MASEKDKKKRTHIQRVYSADKNYWIDIEVLDVATFYGRQFPGQVRGNQASETTVKLNNTPGKTGGRTKGFVKVVMVPPKKGDDPENAPTIMVPVTQSMEMTVKNKEKLTRRLSNGRSNTTPDRKQQEPGQHLRQIVGLAIASNSIDEDLLKETEDGGKAPPSNPRDYREAVRQSDDEASIQLNVAIPYRYFTKRGSGGGHQEVGNRKMWGDNISVNLPGCVPADEKKLKELVVLDPFKSIINFGPDSLAVEFFLGTGPAKEEENK